MEKVLINCDSCTAKPVACGDCVMSVLLGQPTELELNTDEQSAISVLADFGMIPRVAFGNKLKVV